jgi:hypothetical protein
MRRRQGKYEVNTKICGVLGVLRGKRPGKQG